MIEKLEKKGLMDTISPKIEIEWIKDILNNTLKESMTIMKEGVDHVLKNNEKINSTKHINNIKNSNNTKKIVMKDIFMKILLEDSRLRIFKFIVNSFSLFS